MNEKVLNRKFEFSQLTLKFKLRQNIKTIYSLFSTYFFNTWVQETRKTHCDNLGHSSNITNVCSKARSYFNMLKTGSTIF